MSPLPGTTYFTGKWSPALMKVFFPCCTTTGKAAPMPPIKVLFGMMVLKEGQGWSDAQLFDQCRFNLQVMRSLGMFNSDDDVPVESTYYDINITEAKLHDSKGLSKMIFPKDTIIVEDRAYFDFQLMLQRFQAENVFVTRIKANTVFEQIRELELPERGHFKG